MPVLPKIRLSLGDSDRSKLQSIVESGAMRPAIVMRARIVLACAGNGTDTDIAKRLAISKATVAKWRNRFLESGCSGLYDKPRPGKPPKYDSGTIVALVDKIRGIAVSSTHRHGGVRALAAEFGLSKSTVHRYVQRLGLRQLDGTGGLFSDDPLLLQRVCNVVGLYLNPPDNALMVSVKKQSSGLSGDRAGNDAVGSGQVNKEITMLSRALSAAMNIQRQRPVIRHRHRELSELLERIEEGVPDDLEIHLFTDNASMCAHPRIRTWIAAQPRWSVHVAPTSADWLPLVEQLVRAAGNSASRRDAAGSAQAISCRIESFIADYDKKTTAPFLWSKRLGGFLL